MTSLRLVLLPLTRLSYVSGAQEFEGPDMVSRVDGILGASMHDDMDDEVSFSVADTAPPNPYLHYTTPAEGPGESASRVDGNGEKSGRPKSGKKTGKEGRPKSAARKRNN